MSTADTGKPDDLIAFLNARLDEDEAAAKATEHNDGPFTLSWRRGGARRLTFDNDRSEDYESVFAGNWDRILIARDSIGGAPLATHIARHDPARVLREVEAKRAILGRHCCYEPAGACVWCSDDASAGQAYRAPWPCPDVRSIAAAYSDHPDYRQEWAP